MKTRTITVLWGALAWVALFTTSLSGEETEVNEGGETPVAEDALGAPFATVAIPGQIGQSAAVNACIRSATGRGWRIVSKKNGVLTVNLKQKGWDATVHYFLKDDEVVMYSDSYVVDKKTGVRKKKKDPGGWLRNLEKDLTTLLDQATYLE